MSEHIYYPQNINNNFKSIFDSTKNIGFKKYCRDQILDYRTKKDGILIEILDELDLPRRDMLGPLPEQFLKRKYYEEEE